MQPESESAQQLVLFVLHKGKRLPCLVSSSAVALRSALEARGFRLKPYLPSEMKARTAASGIRRPISASRQLTSVH